MYRPKHFDQVDWQRALNLMEEASFAQLITVNAQQELQVSYLPVLYDGDAQAFIFHLAKGNEHCELLLNGSSTLIFNGPHGYISPSWSEDIMVPTWNYTTVHVRGQAQELIQESDKLELMHKMVDFYESAQAQPWQVSDLSAAQQKGMFKAIRCFKMPVDHWEAKYKLSQNRSQRAVEELANTLLQFAKHADAGANESALANLMLAELPVKP